MGELSLVDSFGQTVAEFYGLTAQNPAHIYFAGLSSTNNSDSYEHELDKIIQGSAQWSQNSPVLKKIGLTLHSEIGRQRPDIETLVADLLGARFDGILFVPRPVRWVDWVNGHDKHARTSYSNNFYSLISSILRSTEHGAIFYNLEADHEMQEIMAIARFLTVELDTESLIVEAKGWPTRTHILAKAVEQEPLPVYVPALSRTGHIQ